MKQVRRGKACDWCSGRNEDDPVALCIWHCAEYDGVTVDEYDRMDAAAYYDSL
jgi:hypothetical protein